MPVTVRQYNIQWRSQLFSPWPRAATAPALGECHTSMEKLDVVASRPSSQTQTSVKNGPLTRFRQHWDVLAIVLLAVIAFPLPWLSPRTLTIVTHPGAFDYNWVLDSAFAASRGIWFGSGVIFQYGPLFQWIWAAPARWMGVSMGSVYATWRDTSLLVVQPRPPIPDAANTPPQTTRLEAVSAVAPPSCLLVALGRTNGPQHLSLRFVPQGMVWSTRGAVSAGNRGLRLGGIVCGSIFILSRRGNLCDSSLAACARPEWHGKAGGSRGPFARTLSLYCYLPRFRSCSFSPSTLP